MKKWTLLPVAALLCGALWADDELEIKPVMWRAHNVTVTECAKFLKGVATNTDPALSYSVRMPVDCARYNAVTFDLQIPATEKAQSVLLFWNTTASQGFKEAASLRIVLAKDGLMHRYTAVLAGQPFWSGTLKGFRLDPVSAKLSFTLGEVEFDEDVKLTGWTGGTIQSIRKDEVTGSFTEKSAKDPSVSCRIPGKGLPAEKFGVLELELALDPGCAAGGQIFWEGDAVKLSEKASLKFTLPADGQFHKIKLDLTANPEWKGMIRGIRIDMTHKGVAGKGYQLKDIELKAMK